MHDGPHLEVHCEEDVLAVLQPEEGASDVAFALELDGERWDDNGDSDEIVTRVWRCDIPFDNCWRCDFDVEHAGRVGKEEVASISISPIGFWRFTFYLQLQ